MTENQPSVIKPRVAAELRRVDEDCTHSGKSHFEAAARWGRYHYLIGVPAVIIGGTAGAAFFREWPQIAAGLALFAAALTTLQTFLKSSERSASHRSAGNAYGAIKNDARLLREVKLMLISEGDAVAELEAINSRRNELNSTSPDFSKGDRRRALAGIDAGEARYEVDK